MIDLLVVGGGPAGLLTAIDAAHGGLDVEVWERRPFPVDKACGEGLMPGAVAALAARGVELAGRPFSGIRYLDATGAVGAYAAFRDGPGRGVRRTDLSSALEARVRELGIPVLARAADRLDQQRGHVVVDGTAARYLVAADGLHSRVRRQVGLAGRTRGAPRFGQRLHVRLAPWSDAVEVHWARRAEAYVTPVADDLVGVALLSSERRPFADQLTDFPVLRGRLGRALRATAVRGAGPLHQRASGRVAGRVLLVGDAAGYVDAITGEGIALAAAQAAAAVDAIGRDDPAAYERAWQRITRDYRVITSALLTARGPLRLGGLVVPAAKRLPWLFEAGVDRLARVR